MNKELIPSIPGLAFLWQSHRSANTMDFVTLAEFINNDFHNGDTDRFADQAPIAVSLTAFHKYLKQYHETKSWDFRNSFTSR